MAKKKSKHEWRANSFPAAIMVGPVSLWMVLLVAIPLIYVGVMSFCSIDQYYNVTFQFTLENYTRLMNADYIKIYVQSLVIAFFYDITLCACCLSVFLAYCKNKE